MYSRKVEEVLKKNNIEIGDYIEIENGKIKYKGYLMPRFGIGDENILILKLENQYNIGVKYKPGLKLRKISKSKTIVPKETTKKIHGPEKEKISVISTGGTITSKIDYKTGAVHMLMYAEELLENVPELNDMAEVKLISPFSKASEDMDYKDWQKIAKIAEKELNSDSKGVILAHGTDFMHYTSAALSFMLRNINKPLVITGAQRSSDRGSSDSFFNLICSFHAALSNIAEVGICMHATINDDYCNLIRGTKARKMHSSRRDAFRPVNNGLIAKIFPDGKIEIKNQFRERNQEKVKAKTKFEPKIALLKTYPGADSEVIDFFISKGYKGFVIEASGLGHVPVNVKKSWTEKIKEYSDKAIFAIATQTIYGRVNENVYSNLRILFHKSGAISCKDMLAESAYVKLGWLLGNFNFEKAKDLMKENIAGEFSPREIEDNFLE